MHKHILVCDVDGQFVLDFILGHLTLHIGPLLRNVREWAFKLVQAGYFGRPYHLAHAC